MNRKEKHKILKDLDEIRKIVTAARPTQIRLGDAGTNLSIKKVIENLDERSVTVIWEDGKKTKTYTDDEDEYDFNVGFSLCVAKRLTGNLDSFISSIRCSERYEEVRYNENEKGE